MKKLIKLILNNKYAIIEETFPHKLSDGSYVQSRKVVRITQKLMEELNNQGE